MSKQTRKNPSKPATAERSSRDLKSGDAKAAKTKPAPGKAASAKTGSAKTGSSKTGSSKTSSAKGVSAKAPSAKGKAAAQPKAKAASASPPAPGLIEGAKAPAFTLPRDGGENVTLTSFSGQKLVLFFYPRANTPGCTKEAIDFSRLKPAFADCQTAVLGVSADSVKAQDSFRDKHGLTTPLLSDPTHAMLAAYGAWGEKTLYGRKFEGIIRTTVLISPDGRVARIWRNVKVDGHADQVLAAAQLL